MRPLAIAIVACVGACGSRAPGEVAPDAAADQGPRPLVLVHGLDGFDRIGPIDYFYGVAAALRGDGVDVRVARLDAYNSSDVRGEELRVLVDAVHAETGRRVDLVCHSQGGLDCRYVASIDPDAVARVVTIASPHRGTPLADIALEDAPGPTQDAINALLDLLGATIDGANATSMDAHAAMVDLSSRGAADFARRHPDARTVAYYSIAGRSGLTVADADCTPDLAAPFVTRWQGPDPLDPVLDASAVILDNALGGHDGHDGLVPVASSRWGSFLGCLPADHLDEICQIAGDTPGVGNDFDCVTFYRSLAAWLGDARAE